MAEALPLQTKISQSSTNETDYKTIAVSFGNGYEQRSEDGINSKKAKWVITYSNISLTDRNTVWTFLNIVKKTAWFTWTPPGESGTWKWVIDSPISQTVTSGDTYTITFSIKQVFDLV